MTLSFPIAVGVLEKKVFLLGKMTNQSMVKEIFEKEFPQSSIDELRREMGLGPIVSDEELLLRYVMTDKEVDKMLAAGPVNTTYP